MRWPFSSLDKTTLVSAADALPGRGQPMPVRGHHPVLGLPLDSTPPGTEILLLAMGCFWGAERKMWQVPGVKLTAVGYAGGHTPNPTYAEVCSGRTGHTEVVRVALEPTALDRVLRAFWEGHDPTQGMRQGNDVGTQYRSAIYAPNPSWLDQATRSRDAYQERLRSQGFAPISTELAADRVFYFAEDEHQQYLYKNPGGYCGLGGTGVSCPEGLG
jgi:peptide-methionine (S)-S-oxide reductase